METTARAMTGAMGRMAVKGKRDKNSGAQIMLTIWTRARTISKAPLPPHGQKMPTRKSYELLRMTSPGCSQS